MGGFALKKGESRNQRESRDFLMRPRTVFIIIAITISVTKK